MGASIEAGGDAGAEEQKDGGEALVAEIPEPRQQRTEADRANQRRVEQHSDGAIGVGEDAREQLIGRVGGDGDRHEGETGRIDGAAGAHDQQHAGEPGNGGGPPDRADALAQQRTGQQHYQHWRQEGDRRHLGHRHALQGEADEQRRGGERRGAHQDKAGALGLDELASLAGRKQDDHQQAVDDVADGDDHRHGMVGGENLDAGVHAREQEQRAQEQHDAA